MELTMEQRIVKQFRKICLFACFIALFAAFLISVLDIKRYSLFDLSEPVSLNINEIGKEEVHTSMKLELIDVEEGILYIEGWAYLIGQGSQNQEILVYLESDTQSMAFRPGTYHTNISSVLKGLPYDIDTDSGFKANIFLGNYNSKLFNLYIVVKNGAMSGKRLIGKYAINEIGISKLD